MVECDLSRGGARLPWDALLAESGRVHECLGALFSIVPSPVMVVNRFLQTVYVNDAFLSRFSRTLGEVLGLRIGDLLCCLSAVESLSGCGTSPSCPACPAMRAFSAAYNSRRAVAGVELACRRENRVSLWGVSPMAVEGELHVACVRQP